MKITIHKPNRTVALVTPITQKRRKQEARERRKKDAVFRSGPKSNYIINFIAIITEFIKSLHHFLLPNPSISAAPNAAVATLAPLDPSHGAGSFRFCMAACAPAVNAVRAPACTSGFCHQACFLAALDVGAGADLRLDEDEADVGLA